MPCSCSSPIRSGSVPENPAAYIDSPLQHAAASVPILGTITETYAKGTGNEAAESYNRMR